MKPFSFVSVCLLAICLTTPAFGQSELTADKPTKRKVNSQNVAQVTKERKEQLLAFVDANHPKLKELLSELEKRKKQWPYRQAMAGLDKAVKKLEGLKQRSPKRYDTALEQWKIESRIKVAGAQVKLNDTEESRSELKSLVTQLIDFHLKRMKNDREQTKKRLEALDKRIADAEANREQAIEKRIKSATRKKGKKAKKKE